jgi:hypothetical protein
MKLRRYALSSTSGRTRRIAVLLLAALTATIMTMSAGPAASKAEAKEHCTTAKAGGAKAKVCHGKSKAKAGGAKAEHKHH